MVYITFDLDKYFKFDFLCQIDGSVWSLCFLGHAVQIKCLSPFCVGYDMLCKKNETDLLINRNTIQKQDYDSAVV